MTHNDQIVFNSSIGLSKLMKKLSILLIAGFILSISHESLAQTVLDNLYLINPELKKAAEFYPKNSLKRRAMMFLLENIENKSGISLEVSKKFEETYKTAYINQRPLAFRLHSKQETTKNKRWDSPETAQHSEENANEDSITSEQETIKNKEVINPDAEQHSEEIKNNESITSLVEKYINSNPRSYINDSTEITADLLIENVEYAFKAWELPWAKHLKFEQFCDFILPYRIKQEPKSHWRKYLFDQHKSLINSLIKQNITDPIEVCRTVNDALAQRYKMAPDFNGPMLSIEATYNYPYGDCINRYILLTAICRSLGLPLAIDFNSHKIKGSGEHSWTTLVNDGTGKIMAFDGGSFMDNGLPEYLFKGLKFFRNVYRNHYERITPGLPSISTNPNYIDVTYEYPFEMKDLKIKVENPDKNYKYVGFGSFGDRTDIEVIDSGKLQDNFIVLHDVAYIEDSIVIPLFFKSAELQILDNPKMFKANGTDEQLNPDKSASRKIKLVRKYPVSKDMKDFAEDVIGAKIQGANQPDFSDAVTLFTFKDAPLYFVEIEINDNIGFNYFRFIPVEDKEINLAELNFFLKNNDLSSSLYCGKFISSLPSDYTELKNINAQNIRTNLMIADYNNWIGIDVSQDSKRYLQKIRILPRNNFNEIEKNHEYELLYFDKKWISLEKKKADDFYIEFDNVPDNCVLLLKDLTDGKEERVFTYVDGHQVFW